MVASNKDKAFLKRLGQHLRDLRQKRGWTLEEAEEHGWRSWQHLQRIESGKNITVITLRQLAELYGLTLSELVEDI